MTATNEWGLPVGDRVDLPLPRPRPSTAPREGRFCRLVPASEDHAEELARAYARDDGRNWTYLPSGPPRDADEMRDRLRAMAASHDPLYFTVLTDDGAVGTASYLRIAPEVGSVEVGWISFSPLLQRTPASTEAMALMMTHVFALGYRRYEWKCDALNVPSRRAAERLGFNYEGTFRQAVVVKGRNRDTAWFSILDRDWPTLETRFGAWLDPENFDADGRQRRRLGEIAV